MQTYEVVLVGHGAIVRPISIRGTDNRDVILGQFPYRKGVDSLFYARLFIKALELADAGAPILDGLMENEDNEYA